jgi:hypothetical protein
MDLLDNLWSLSDWNQFRWTFQTVLLVLILFLGPLALEWAICPSAYLFSWKSWQHWFREEVWQWISWRNCFFVRVSDTDLSS